MRPSWTATVSTWTFLSRVLPEGVELIDFFHAAQHLSDAFDAAYGANAPKAVAQFEKYRHLLRYDDDGVAQVIRALRHLRSKRWKGHQFGTFFVRRGREMLEWIAEAMGKRVDVDAEALRDAVKDLEDSGGSVA